MSFYRTLLATAMALAVATPVFADDMGSTSTMMQQNASAASTSSMPSTSAPTTDQTATAASDQQAAKVNINTATAKELMKVKGMTAAKAKAIVAYRKKHGNFKSMNQLSNVRGFKKLPAAKMKAMQAQMSM